MIKYRYPTEDILVNDICEFLYNRLPSLFGSAPKVFNDKPSLQEDWWVEEKIKAGYIIPNINDNEESLQHISLG